MLRGRLVLDDIFDERALQVGRKHIARVLVHRAEPIHVPVAAGEPQGFCLKAAACAERREASTFRRKVEQLDPNRRGPETSVLLAKEEPAAATDVVVLTGDDVNAVRCRGAGGFLTTERSLEEQDSPSN